MAFIDKKAAGIRHDMNLTPTAPRNWR